MSSDGPVFRVLLFGAGALGSVFAWRLQASGRAEVTVVCRSNYEAVKQDGFRISSTMFGDHVYRPSRVARTVAEAVQDGTVFDFVIVSTKALPNIHDNSDMIAAAVGPQTAVLLIQNGIGIEDPFHVRLPRTPIVSVVAYIDTSQPANGVIEHGDNAMLFMGLHHAGGSPAADDSSAKERLLMLSQMWNDGGVQCSVVDNIQAFRWLKLVWNASFNTVAVASGGNDVAEVLRDPGCTRLVRRIMEEVYRVGEAATGAPLPERGGVDGPDALIAWTARYPGVVAPSMLMDFRAGRPLEHAVILGQPIQVARSLGIDVPCMETVHALLVMTEKRYLQRPAPPDASLGD
ncbi:hypothetical protein GGI04_004284 [Coemansia thaxteri]|uniref:2-dehydropantoate 2-reductase n=1 Tax=Coemansia thaxteri TaxID=2663907 RepID=A0A9W8BH30_9FUNG|nr:hypothetical protein GGI04_004284 [Coemansia thaxteri]KAJ2000740.1 hypothetical protein H4R26_004473 [Coemansia thaxteri]KAJ2467262.1 hypothetical protein GGI02_004094 [Coemansia sp. RSA 2322]KAJ2478543.1 hypothetical protein EV174_004287 [Coemansia sp. RSA 2320]